MRIYPFIFFMLIALTPSCAPDKTTADKAEKKETPKLTPLPIFSHDSAYVHIEKQLSFGPRVPGTEAHLGCRDYLKSTLERYGARANVQSFNAKRFDGVPLKGYNVIGSFNTSAKQRILLCAHWDSRFTSDQDSEDMKDKPVPGADDGASGVGVLLELARLFGQEEPAMGIDIVFFDLEDQGTDSGSDPESWCLGSQHWSKNPHMPTSLFRFGILLDMVGSKDAQFPKEGTSRQYAGRVLDNVWSVAQQMGYNHLFINRNSSGILDDHYYINRLTGIPTIDIINRTSETETGFGHYWHTQEDDIDIISKPTLKAVGRVLTKVVYREAENI